ncbi:hypothetical protein HYPSUDRAFT_201632 [Hypholoma sublateritium FD-334 SS-4]|uniref:Uncharacterized protein n=1 Tax=Hypholoma sublateritium (strain FD-334 SS-4) TaxID=945553 RepID=A0A0D2MHF0_HYPSF|nr:hypothetical protein HYPSUDRAFT_201632 [Hypholoma sublateritium FD-334 SS-4]
MSWCVAGGTVLPRGWQPALMPPGGNKMCTGRQAAARSEERIRNARTRGACDHSQAPADARTRSGILISPAHASHGAGCSAGADAEEAPASASWDPPGDWNRSRPRRISAAPEGPQRRLGVSRLQPRRRGSMVAIRIQAPTAGPRMRAVFFAGWSA